MLSPGNCAYGPRAHIRRRLARTLAPENAKRMVENRVAVANFSPERAILTIVTAHGTGGFAGPVADMRSIVKAALTDVPGLTPMPDVMVTSRFVDKRLPKRFAQEPRVGSRAGHLMRSLTDHTTQVRVSWRGRSDQTIREEVVRRLRNLFPQARIGVRCW
jgi:hypothetical protein